jgi:hypothetical protein
MTRRHSWSWTAGPLMWVWMARWVQAKEVCDDEKESKKKTPKETE